jgi:hypothetical protein
MSGYLRSTNPTGMNRRVYGALALLDRFENTDAYKGYRAKGYSVQAALQACADAENG